MSHLYSMLHRLSSRLGIAARALSAGTILEAQCDLEPRNVDHCCIQDWGALSWSGYAINSDPRLRSNGKIGWLSPCIDAGDVTLYPGMDSDPHNRRNYDVEGRDRVQGISRVFNNTWIVMDPKY